ncbi:MAG: phosphopantetheine-binding protein [Burkholderiales bacterium]
MSNSTAPSDHPVEQSPEAGAADAALLQEVAALIVASLNLEVDPQQIGPADPLYGEGLGLDSIDMLEVALVVSKQYGFQMRANDESNVAIFGSLQSLADHIAAHRTQ